MQRHYCSRMISSPIMIAGVCSSIILSAGAAEAQTAASGYSLSLFAGPLAGSSQPDSIAVVGRNVYVGYGNGADKKGQGGSSTIAEYSWNGSLLNTASILGHNDGLRYDPATGKIWAIQNEDGNPTIAMINPTTLAVTAPQSVLAVNGGGFDDVAFKGATAYISASNPANNPNSDPAIVSATVSGNTVTIGGSVLKGNATATIVGGGTTALNLQDPDSLTFDPNGQLVLTSQADQELLFTTPGSSSVSVLDLAAPNGCPANGNCTVDDTVFGTGHRQRLLITDRGTGNIYALVGNFANGAAYSAADSLNEIVNVDLTTGKFTPLVTGLMSPHGEAFTAGIPESSTWAMMALGFAGLGLAGYRGSRQAAALRA